MAPTLLAALLIDALFGLWRPGWLRDMRPDLLHQRVRNLLHEDFLPGFDQRLLGTAVLALALGVAALFGWLLASLPLSAVWTLVLSAIVLGMKRLSHHANGVADALRDSAEMAELAIQRFTGQEAPGLDQIAPTTYAALSGRMARDVLTPSLALLAFGLPGLLVSATIRWLRNLDPAGSGGFGWAAHRLDTVINWPANWITCALLDRIDPDIVDGDRPVHIEARVEALWKVWLCLLGAVALLTLL